MLNRYSNKRPVESFIVATGTENSAAIYNTSNGGNNITGSSPFNVVLADGQIGIFDATGFGTAGINTAVDTTPTITEAPVIYIAQGTPQSTTISTTTATYPLWPLPYRRSGNIDGRVPVQVTKRTYQADTYSTWVTGKADGNVNEIKAYDNTEYALRIGFQGRREDEYYAPEATNHLSVSFTTPNYTTLATVNPKDHLIENLLWQVNRNSKLLGYDRRFKGTAPIIAFAIDTAGAAGTVIDDGAGTAIDAGEFVPVINTSVGVRGITVTAAQAASIKAAAAAASLPSTSTIITIDLATAGTTTGGTADVMMFMALDADLAWEDLIPQVKTRLRVGLVTGFDYQTVYNQELVKAFEGSGSGRLWNLRYKATQGQRMYSLDHTLDPVIEFASPVDTTKTYVSYNIENVPTHQVDTFNIVDAPQRTIVLIPSTETTAITNFDTYVNSWLSSGGWGNIETI